jgi:hypothetical protein
MSISAEEAAKLIAENTAEVMKKGFVFTKSDGKSSGMDNIPVGATVFLDKDKKIDGWWIDYGES